ncbi:MAG: hypothetical protein LBO00_07600 [Zoogloeaceae bacterium]|jgi:hypothetical protein|nr:hypothetical protein [Zoogloeaceae bacterium]
MPIKWGQIYATKPGTGGWNAEGGGDDPGGDGETPPSSAGRWAAAGDVDLLLEIELTPVAESTPEEPVITPPPGSPPVVAPPGFPEPPPKPTPPTPPGPGPGPGPGPDPGEGGIVTLPEVPEKLWRGVITLEGEDVSDYTIGEIEIRAAEGAARIASFTLLLPPETILSLAAWSGLTVTIDYCEFQAGQVASYSRLFTGVVDSIEYDPNTRQIGVLATDDLRAEIDAMTDEQVDELTEGRWHSNIFEAAKSHGHQRAEDRMSTRAASLDLDVWRTPRVTPWAQANDDAEFNDDEIEDGSLSIAFAERSSLINRVEINFAYRYAVAQARTVFINFDCVTWAEYCYGHGHMYPGVDIRPNHFDAMMMAGWNMLRRDAVTNALGSVGGEVQDINWYEVPGSHWATTPGGTDWAFVISEELRPQMCQGFDAKVSLTSQCDRQENHFITVEFPASIAQSGIIGETMEGAMEAAFYDGPQVETQTALFRSGVVPFPPRETGVARQSGYLTHKALPDVEGIVSEDTNREAAAEAMECLIDIAKARIAAAHRQTQVSATVILNPDVDLDRFFRVDTPSIKARGKVSALTHSLNHDTGRAVSSFTLSVSTVAGTGIVHPDTPTKAPDPLPPKDKPKEYVVVGDIYGMEGGFVPPGGYPPGHGSNWVYVNYYGLTRDVHVTQPLDSGEFFIVFPGLDDEDRVMQEEESHTTINAGVPEDECVVIT